jgi:anaerobic magnesium-protoporphyrin IX monomethyl ester cyclase
MPKVHFIFPTMAGKWPVSLYGVGMPVAPSVLYSYAKSLGFGQYEGGVCRDSSLSSDSAILADVNEGDLVCVTATVTGYFPAINLLRQAKDRGATVAIGGPWVSARAKQIFKRRSWIDFVVDGEGEKPLDKILCGEAERGVLRGESIRLSEMPSPDFSGWRHDDLKTCSENYRQMIAGGEYGRPPEQIPVFVFYQSTRGCIQRPRCAFCGSRIGDRLSWRTAEQFYLDIESIRRQFADINGRIHVFDTSDSFTSALGRFGGEFRGHEGVTFTVFARVDEVNSETAIALRQLGVTKVSLGIESGSTGSLTDMGKNTTVEQNQRAVRLLADQGISVYINFMYGLPGETVESLRQTVDHIVGLCRIGNVYRAKGRITTPLPRSRWFFELVRARPELDDDSDWLSPEKLVRAWLEERTTVTLREINEAHAVFVRMAKELGVTYSSETAVWFG